ncbi:uncharacterized protein PADG_11952 [Paracoccidioides brasiliensis Pb18]|uniref:Uncharacterized protein n=1 Tax=Paracoccidioides brasiliensis (strain Pb18) TaxID=502780 RepID=A0A0A0HTH9_PARBD|nr:uncharacterized protein PADG_11952 [Paracoccidioides brasiliensis Pb18]KGM91972.1 hypothetical protein PADG_11952 [Paracoccidioides brasiliensis Pb18]
MVTWWHTRAFGGIVLAKDEASRVSVFHHTLTNLPEILSIAVDLLPRMVCEKRVCSTTIPEEVSNRACPHLQTYQLARLSLRQQPFSLHGNGPSCQAQLLVEHATAHTPGLQKKNVGDGGAAYTKRAPGCPAAMYMQLVPEYELIFKETKGKFTQ